jgi:hypothetical protein
MTSDAWTPSRRDGHLSELDLELLFADPDGHPRVAAHAAGCGDCTARLTALRDQEASLAASGPPPALAAVLPPPVPANRPFAVLFGLTSGIAVAAAALVAVVVVLRTPLDDGYTVKGSAVDLEVFAHDGVAVRPLADGSDVHPRERLGFRLTTREPGYLLVVGRDDSGTEYPCWPADGRARSVAASGIAEDLDAAVRLDDRLGTETISALLCTEPVTLGDAMEVLAGRGAAECVVETVALHKVAAGQGTE